MGIHQIYICFMIFGKKIKFMIHQVLMGYNLLCHSYWDDLIITSPKTWSHPPLRQRGVWRRTWMILHVFGGFFSYVFRKSLWFSLWFFPMIFPMVYRFLDGWFHHLLFRKSHLQGIRLVLPLLNAATRSPDPPRDGQGWLENVEKRVGKSWRILERCLKIWPRSNSVPEKNAGTGYSLCGQFWSQAEHPWFRLSFWRTNQEISGFQASSVKTLGCDGPSPNIICCASPKNADVVLRCPQ